MVNGSEWYTQMWYVLPPKAKKAHQGSSLPLQWEVIQGTATYISPGKNYCNMLQTISTSEIPSRCLHPWICMEFPSRSPTSRAFYEGIWSTGHYLPTRSNLHVISEVDQCDGTVTHQDDHDLSDYDRQEAEVTLRENYKGGFSSAR